MTVLTTEGAVFRVDTERVACYGDVTIQWHTDGSAIGYHGLEAAFCLDRRDKEAGRSLFVAHLFAPHEGKALLDDCIDQIHLELQAMIRYKFSAREALVKW